MDEHHSAAFEDHRRSNLQDSDPFLGLNVRLSGVEGRVGERGRNKLNRESEIMLPYPTPGSK